MTFMIHHTFINTHIPVQANNGIGCCVASPLAFVFVVSIVVSCGYGSRNKGLCSEGRCPRRFCSSMCNGDEEFVRVLLVRAVPLIFLQSGRRHVRATPPWREVCRRRGLEGGLARALTCHHLL